MAARLDAWLATGLALHRLLGWALDRLVGWELRKLLGWALCRLLGGALARLTGTMLAPRAAALYVKKSIETVAKGCEMSVSAPAESMRVNLLQE